MAEKAADAGLAGPGTEELLAAPGAWGERHGLGLSKFAHEDRECEPVRYLMLRVVESLVARIRDIGAGDVVRLVYPLRAGRGLVGAGRKKIVGPPHLHVVGLAGEHRPRFVLRLPSKARDGAVVAAAVGHAADAERSPLGRRGAQIGEDGRVLDRLDQ